MEIKVTYQGVEKAVIVFKAYTSIELMRRIGYGSFSVRSQITKYEYFASFRNENTEDYIFFYPDKSFIKRVDFKLSFEELGVIKEILDNCYAFNYSENEEESD